MKSITPSRAALFLLLIALLAGLLKFISGPESINNYLIFKYSYFNLKDGVNLYELHPAQHFDLYKYSPTFSALMAPFYYLPDIIGYFLWTFLNAGILLYAISKINAGVRNQFIILGLITFELITSIQNSQSNPLIAGLLLLAFMGFERRNVILAALMIALAFYIKVFGIAFAALFILYPEKGKFVLWMALWICALAALPLIFTDPVTLEWQYENWITLLKNDPAHELNYSIMTFFERTFGIIVQDIIYLLPGIIILLLPVIRRNQYSSHTFRLTLAGSFLIWFVIFNHKAESPTYIIAMTGVGLWFISSEKRKWEWALVIFALLITSLSSTDLFPRIIREDYIKPFALKALPCIIIWIVCASQLLGKRFPVAEKQ